MSRSESLSFNTGNEEHEVVDLTSNKYAGNDLYWFTKMHDNFFVLCYELKVQIPSSVLNLLVVVSLSCAFLCLCQAIVVGVNSYSFLFLSSKKLVYSCTQC